MDRYRHVNLEEPEEIDEKLTEEQHYKLEKLMLSENFRKKLKENPKAALESKHIYVPKGKDVIVLEGNEEPPQDAPVNVIYIHMKNKEFYAEDLKEHGSDDHLLTEEDESYIDMEERLNLDRRYGCQSTDGEPGHEGQ